MLGKKSTKKEITKSSKSKSLTTRKSVPSVISDDMNILGNLISDGYIDINGHVEGNVKCHTLTIRDSGMIKGDILADHLQVYGQVSGVIKASHVYLAPTARVRGVIMHESLSVEDGAFIDGQCKRTDRHMMEKASFKDEDDSDEEESLQKDRDNIDLIENFRVVSEK